MSNVLSNPVLLLDKGFRALEVKLASQALTMCYAGVATALHIDSVDGMYPVRWSDWVQLPVREGDAAVHTQRLVIRIPTVVISASYNQIHKRRPALNPRTVRERDQHVCQYCGHRFPASSLNMDHVQPASRGGQKIWTNIACACRRCNTVKDNRTPAEAGMRLLRQPFEPRLVPLATRLIAEHQRLHPDWQMFLTA